MPLVIRNVQTLQLLISAYSSIYVQAVRVDQCRNSPTGLGRAAGDLRTATSAGADERLGQGQQAAGCRPAASGGTMYGPTNAVAVAALQQARFVESLFHSKDTETNFFLMHDSRRYVRLCSHMEKTG
jgi:hypothetical protein